MNFSNLHRASFIQQLTSQEFDLLVVGGGITGCGIALDAALRGMKVALVEKNDFASGTSSRSTKLIHGGLRYLKQFEFKLVRDVGTERAVVHRNARHLVIPEKMLLPIIKGGSLNEFSTSIGLLVYDLLAGVKKGERRIMLDRHATLKAEPLLNAANLLGGGLYFEYRTDDSRLTIELAKSAFANGALFLNYAELKGFLQTPSGKICGAKIEDKTEGGEFDIRAKVVVNACGPWVDLLRKKDNSLRGKRLQLTKGVHLVFPHSKLPLQQAAYFDTADGRMIFAIPRNNITYVGTTDTVYNQEIDAPKCMRDDAQYLLNAVNSAFVNVNLQVSDIESTWAGLRPLIHEDGKSPSELSRKDEIMISESGLVSIAGGKLTGYRLMAEKIVDLAAKTLGKHYGKCKTKNYLLCGGIFEDDIAFQKALKDATMLGEPASIPESKVHEWFFRYGSNTQKIIENVASLSSAIKEPETLFNSAEVKYAVEHEMVMELNDFLIRRTGKIFFDKPQSEKQIPLLAEMLGDYLKLTPEKQTAIVENTLREYVLATTL
ncbi:MAG: glycerol-3-phosphate dehydrogenase/oxidase [Chitinophagales bacterium]|nr:glycerol-3-phosphate dehydrogenase/oxidase [Chitinophagales bacterium]